MPSKIPHLLAHYHPQVWTESGPSSVERPLWSNLVDYCTNLYGNVMISIVPYMVKSVVAP